MYHMEAIGGICDGVRVVVPVIKPKKHSGEVYFSSRKVTIVPVSDIPGNGIIRKLFSIPWFFYYLLKFIKEINATYGVHVPIPSDIGAFGVLVAHLMNKPMFIRHCGNWYKQRTTMEKIWKWYIEKYAGGKNLFLTTGGGDSAPSDKNSNIEWVFSTSLSDCELKQNRINRRFASENQICLVSVSRQVESKGTGRVIQSLAQLHERYKNVHLVIVGDGPDLNKFKALVKKLNIEHIVKFTGKLNHEEVLEKLKLGDIFCYPTQASEGFPKVVLEALSCGLPVITNSVSVLSQLIGNTQSGIVMQSGSPEELATSIIRIIEDEDLYKFYSSNAFDTAGNYSLEAWVHFIKIRIDKAWNLT